MKRALYEAPNGDASKDAENQRPGTSNTGQDLLAGLKRTSPPSAFSSVHISLSVPCPSSRPLLPLIGIIENTN